MQYYYAKFPGVYEGGPTGVAVAVAHTRLRAKQLIEKRLGEEGLPRDLSIHDIRTLDDRNEDVAIITNGDY